MSFLERQAIVGAGGVAVKSLWWITLSTIGCALVAAGVVVHALGPYYRLLLAGIGIATLVVAVLGAAIAARSGTLDDD